MWFEINCSVGSHAVKTSFADSIRSIQEVFFSADRGHIHDETTLAMFDKKSSGKYGSNIMATKTDIVEEIVEARLIFPEFFELIDFIRLKRLENWLASQDYFDCGKSVVDQDVELAFVFGVNPVKQSLDLIIIGMIRVDMDALTSTLGNF